VQNVNEIKLSAVEFALSQRLKIMELPQEEVQSSASGECKVTAED